MYLLNVSRLNQGQVLGKSLYDENSKLLLAAGYKISDQIIKLLKKHGFRSVYVSDGLTDEITPEEVISSSLRMSSNKLVIETFDEIRNHPSIRKNTALKTLDPEKLKSRINDDPKLNHIIRMPEVKNIVENIMDDIISNNISMFAALPIKSDSGKDYEHAIDTTILCILMGRLFDYNWKDLYSLASSALLHDIGKAVIPQVSPEEQKVYYGEHPTYSMLLVQGNDPSGFSKHFTVHHHHEELNGEGYPQGLTAHDISPARRSPTNRSEIFHHAFILSVANYYDNLISGEVDDTIYSPEQALQKIISEAGTRWNSYAVQALASVIERYPVGARVRIIEASLQKLKGFVGVVARTNPKKPTQPLIIVTHNPLGNQITPIKIDLANLQNVKLELDR